MVDSVDCEGFQVVRGWHRCRCCSYVPKGQGCCFQCCGWQVLASQLQRPLQALSLVPRYLNEVITSHYQLGVFLKFNLAGFCFFPRLGLTRGLFLPFLYLSYLTRYLILSIIKAPQSPYPQLPIVYSYFLTPGPTSYRTGLCPWMNIFNTLSPLRSR